MASPSPTTLKVLSPGLCTLVVDTGRSRYRSLGVPVGGAADRFALTIGNALVGNPPDAAALEISLSGPTLCADSELACVVYGAPFDLASNRQALTSGKTFTLQPGEELRIGGTPRGMRGYFCVRGGLQTAVVLGSRSGLEPLRAGTEIPCFSGTIHGRFVRVGEHGFPGWYDPDGTTRTVTLLPVLPGPQASWFPAESFFHGVGQEFPPFTVTPTSNRMGLRLAGQPLPFPEREMISEPVCPGTVQVTRDGQCIILGVDGQTIGGYPRIAQVVSASLDELGQLRPGDHVQFTGVTLEEAETLWRQKQAFLREWVVRLRTAEVSGP